MQFIHVLQHSFLKDLIMVLSIVFFFLHFVSGILVKLWWVLFFSPPVFLCLAIYRFEGLRETSKGP